MRYRCARWILEQEDHESDVAVETTFEETKMKKGIGPQLMGGGVTYAERGPVLVQDLDFLSHLLNRNVDYVIGTPVLKSGILELDFEQRKISLTRVLSEKSKRFSRVPYFYSSNGPPHCRLDVGGGIEINAIKGGSCT